jgi:hypothetical protein
MTWKDDDDFTHCESVGSVPWLFSAWRPDQSIATRTRIWDILGVSRYKIGTVEHEALYTEWMDRVFISALELPREPARVMFRALQAFHNWEASRVRSVYQSYRIQDIVHGLDSMSWAIAVDGRELAYWHERMEPGRDFLTDILVAMDARGWDQVDITFH